MPPTTQKIQPTACRAKSSSEFQWEGMLVPTGCAGGKDVPAPRGARRSSTKCERSSPQKSTGRRTPQTAAAHRYCGDGGPKIDRALAVALPHTQNNVVRLTPNA